MSNQAQTVMDLHRSGGASEVMPGSASSPVARPKFAKPRRAIGLPEIAEVDVVRHYTRLSQESHGVDNGPYPLGSCTMKYNPKRNDALAGEGGFRHAHPMQPPETLGGVWELYE